MFLFIRRQKNNKMSLYNYLLQYQKINASFCINYILKKQQKKRINVFIIYQLHTDS